MKRRIGIGLVGGLVLLAVGTTAWTASIRVRNYAALEGNYGLEVVMNGRTSSAYVQDNTPDNHGIYRVEFLLDINTLVFGANSGPGSNHAILKFWDMSEVGPYPRQFLIIGLRLGLDGRRKIFAKISNPDGSLCFRNEAGIPMELNLPTLESEYPIRVRVEYSRASAPGATDGLVRLTRKTQSATGFTGRAHSQLPSYPLSVDQVTFGGTGGMDATSTGSYFLDSFVSYETLAP